MSEPVKLTITITAEGTSQQVGEAIAHLIKGLDPDHVPAVMAQIEQQLLTGKFKREDNPQN